MFLSSVRFPWNSPFGLESRLPLFVFDLASDLWHRTWRSVTAFKRTEPALALRLIFLSGGAKALMFFSRLTSFSALGLISRPQSSFKSLFHNKIDSDSPKVSQKLSAALNIWNQGLEMSINRRPMGDDHKIPVTCHYTSRYLPSLQIKADRMVMYINWISTS